MKYRDHLVAAASIVLLMAVILLADNRLSHLSINDTVTPDYLSLDAPRMARRTAVTLGVQASEVEEIVVEDWLETARRSRRNRSRSF